MVLFSQRQEIERMFYAWCQETKAAVVPSNMVAFMRGNGWLNEDKIVYDLRSIKQTEAQKEDK